MDRNASNQVIARKSVADEFDSDVGVVDADEGNDGNKVMKPKIEAEAEEEVAHQPVKLAKPHDPRNEAAERDKEEVVAHQPVKLPKPHDPRNEAAEREKEEVVAHQPEKLANIIKLDKMLQCIWDTSSDSTTNQPYRDAIKFMPFQAETEVRAKEWGASLKNETVLTYSFYSF